MTRSLVSLLFTLAAAAAIASPGPDLRVYIVGAGSDPRHVAAPAQKLSMLVGVSNRNGGADAQGAVLTITMPVGLNFERAGRKPDGGEGRKLRWSLGILKAGESARIFELDARTGADVPIGSDLLLTAEVTSSGAASTDPTNRQIEYRIHVQRPGADLAVESDLRAAALYPGRSATFATTVTNLGNATANEAVLAIALPRGITLSDANPKPNPGADSNMVTWALGDLQRGETRTVKTTVDLDPRLAMQLVSKTGSLTFYLDASSATPDTDPAGNHLKIVRRVDDEGHDVAVWLNVEGGPSGELIAGKDATLVMIYANIGIETAGKAVATLRGPMGMDLASAKPVASRTSRDDRREQSEASWDLGELRRGAQGMVRIPIRVAAGDGSRFTAAISAEGRDVNADNNIADTLLRESRASGKSTAIPAGASAQQTIWLLPALSALVLLGALVLVMWWMRKRKLKGKGGHGLP